MEVKSLSMTANTATPVILNAVHHIKMHLLYAKVCMINPRRMRERGLQ